MGSMLQNVTKGKIIQPLLILIYGPDGVGKSSFGSRAPNPVFLGPEQGSFNLDVARLPKPQSFDDVKKAIKELTEDEHNYKSLVIDSIDWIEPLIIEPICRASNVKSINKAGGGYGNGPEEVIGVWKEFMASLILLREKRKMNIILIAHADIVDFTDPQAQMAYQRYQLKLHKKSNPLFREFVDAVLFANYDTFAKKEGSEVIAYSSGSRVIYTERRPGFDAKNRFGLPFTMPLSIEWQEFADACRVGTPESVESLKSRITGLIPMVKDEELRKKVEEAFSKAGEEVKKLVAIVNKLEVITSE